MMIILVIGCEDIKRGGEDMEEKLAGLGLNQESKQWGISCFLKCARKTT